MNGSFLPVHVPGEGRWHRISEAHTSARLQELRRIAGAFDDGFYMARRYAEAAGFEGLKHHQDRRTAAGFTDHRDNCLNYTDDEVLAARVALEMVGPAKSSIWEKW